MTLHQAAPKHLRDGRTTLGQFPELHRHTDQHHGEHRRHDPEKENRIERVYTDKRERTGDSQKDESNDRGDRKSEIEHQDNSACLGFLLLRKKVGHSRRLSTYPAKPDWFQPSERDHSE